MITLTPGRIPDGCATLGTVNLILLKPEELDPHGRATLSDDRARHIRHVLGAEKGKTLVVGVLNGPRGRGTVVSVQREEVVLACAFDPSRPPAPRIDLLLAMPRPKVMKRLWAQLAALGVGRIYVTNAWKVEKCYFDTHVLDPAFYTPLLIEGLQQVGDTALPRVSVHRRFRPWVEDELAAFDPGVRRLVLDPAAATCLAGTGQAERLLLAIGPEGGWTPYELDLLHAHGFLSAALGNRVLRSDTACVAALAVAAGLLKPDTGGLLR